MTSQPIDISLWRRIMRSNFTDWKKLADFLELTEEQRSHIIVDSRFPLNLPLRLANKIAKGTLNDPILRQFLPSKDELHSIPGFINDPVGEKNCRFAPQLLQKYQGRVLLICTSACVMHCRFCFRRHFDYVEPEKTFSKEFEFIENDPSIHEVILSGGDPLSLGNDILEYIFERIQQIKHVKRIRFHTRFPMGIPERIDASFLELINRSRCQVYFVTHINHPNELDDQVWDALGQIRRMGAILLNQTVLVKDINDDVEVLAKLCEDLADHGVIPYYLHQLDRVQGSAHFEVSEARGLQLIDSLMKRLSGYAVPRFVKEVAGVPNKVPLM